MADIDGDGETPRDGAEQPQRPEHEQRAAQVSAEIRERSEGMPPALREELFSQTRLVRDGREEVAPALYVDAADGIAVFQGLNSDRDLLEAVDDAVKEIVKDPKAAEELYRKKQASAAEPPSKP